MYYDDRLATVLNAHETGDHAVATQYRQLLDLLGSTSHHDSPLIDQAYTRLQTLAGQITPQARKAILREPGLRLTSSRLAYYLSTQEPDVAAAAMASARLSDDEWVALIPQLPLKARGFLRHRTDLQNGAARLLDQLGLRDQALPAPAIAQTSTIDGAKNQQADSPLAQTQPAEPDSPDTGSQIREIVQRIDNFRTKQASAPSATAPHLAFSPADSAALTPDLAATDFTTDSSGIIIWAEPSFAPMMAGLNLSNASEDAPARLDDNSSFCLQRHQPIHNGTLALCGAAPIEGQWRINAIPLFHERTGHFSGYYGRLQRDEEMAPPDASSQSTMREMLHELKTPANAIQGFAEIIQQQLFGPAPHEYRAIAAAIAADAARLLAGFDEVDRLVRLETEILETTAAHTDLLNVLHDLADRVAPSLQARNANLNIKADRQHLLVNMAEQDAERLAWRMLAALTASLAPDETLTINLTGEEGMAHALFSIPSTLAGREDLFAATTPAAPVTLSAGMFGVGFALRLARAECRAAGGHLRQNENALALALPRTETDNATSPDDDISAAAGKV